MRVPKVTPFGHDFRHMLYEPRDLKVGKMSAEARGVLRFYRHQSCCSPLRAVVDLLFHFRRHIRSDTVAGEFSEGCSGGGNNAIRHATAGNLWIELARTDAGIAMRARDGGYGAKEVRYGLVLPAVGQIHCTQPK